MRPLALFAALALALPALAEEKVDVKLNVKKGLKFTRSREITGDGNSTQALTAEGGMTINLQQAASVACVMKNVEEVLDAKDGAPVTLRRLHTRRDYKVMLGAFGGKSRSGTLLGKEIKLEGGKWSGGSEDDLKDETAGDRMTLALASGKAVALNATWEADKEKTKAWVSECFPGFLVDEVEMECNLEEIKEKDGQKSARIEFSLKATGKVDVQNAKDAVITLKGDAWYGIESGMVLAVKAEGKFKHAKKGDDDEEGGEGGFGPEKLDVPIEFKQTVKVGEADFSAKVEEPPKPPKPEWHPSPIR